MLEKLEFDSVSAASRDTLTDILQACGCPPPPPVHGVISILVADIEELGHVSHNASELANRTEVRV